MTYREEKFMEDLTKIAMEIAELRAENKLLKSMNERLLQALPIHGVVRGGDKYVLSVDDGSGVIKNTEYQVTPNTTTEPLPAEAVAQNGRDGVMKWCDSCGKITYWLDGECENYKARGGSAKGVLPF